MQISFLTRTHEQGDKITTEIKKYILLKLSTREIVKKNLNKQKRGTYLCSFLVSFSAHT